MGKKDTLFDKMVKTAKKSNEHAFILNEDNPYDVKNWTDTGCYILNAVLSDGDIFKGIPDGKRIMVSGESSTAKSLFTCFMIGAYLRAHKKSYAVFFETEGATVTQMAKSIGIPEDRMIVIPVTTVEECRTQMVKLLDQVLEAQKDAEKYDGEKFIFCIDSLGMLSTAKETEDIAAGSDKKDMTRAALLKAFARVTSLKLSIAQIPLLLVNHTYATFDMYNPRAASGGSGPAYMNDVHLMLFKTKEREGKEQVGVKIRLNVQKSRFMIENQNVYIILHFKKGLYRMSHLVDMAYETLGVFKKDKLSFVFPNGESHAMRFVRAKPSKYINRETLTRIGDAIKDHFGFGELDADIDIEDELAYIDENVNREDEVAFDENDS